MSRLREGTEESERRRRAGGRCGSTGQHRGGTVRTVVETPVRAAAAADAPVSVGDWFVTLLLTCIPIVGIIMIFVWAFGGGTNPSKKNWARATLIWALVGIVLSVVFGASIVALFANALS